jgi:hypothetical protein
MGTVISQHDATGAVHRGSLMSDQQCMKRLCWAWVNIVRHIGLKIFNTEKKIFCAAVCCTTPDGRRTNEQNKPPYNKDFSSYILKTGSTGSSHTGSYEEFCVLRYDAALQYSFGRTCRLHLQDWRIIQTKNNSESKWQGEPCCQLPSKYGFNSNGLHGRHIPQDTTVHYKFNS